VVCGWSRRYSSPTSCPGAFHRYWPVPEIIFGYCFNLRKLAKFCELCNCLSVPPHLLPSGACLSVQPACRPLSRLALDSHHNLRVAIFLEDQVYASSNQTNFCCAALLPVSPPATFIPFSIYFVFCVSKDRLARNQTCTGAVLSIQLSCALLLLLLLLPASCFCVHSISACCLTAFNSFDRLIQSIHGTNYWKKKPRNRVKPGYRVQLKVSPQRDIRISVI